MHRKFSSLGLFFLVARIQDTIISQIYLEIPPNIYGKFKHFEQD
jgi:hypothetical protein